MIVETLLTKFLKHKNAVTLRFDEFKDIAPPTPKPDVDYLLYIHIPFCEELCPYCSFNRFPFEKKQALDYFDALQREIQIYGELGFDFRSVYIGGGTPTVLPDEISILIKMLRKDFGLKEVSLETNPNHLTDTIISKLQDAGVNRLSVGVQSFDDGLLKQMERFHKYGSGAEIQERLCKYMGSFDTLNVDMIFNFPTQTMEQVERDVEIIKNIRADQATFYPLMVSDMTRRELAKRFGAISYSQEKRFYNRIAEMLGDDYGCGTAWCFSRKETMIDEYIVDYDEYVGAGSGSFGYINGACYANTFSIRDYISSIRRNKLPILAKKNFSKMEQIHYDFMMKLFGTSINVDKAENKFQGNFLKSLWKEIPFLKLIGALERDGSNIRLTGRGQYLWVIMMREFFTGVNNFRDICRAGVKESD